MKDDRLAMEFWNRVDNLWFGKSLKELAYTVGVDYVLLLNWRTKKRLPSLEHACSFAKVLNTTVEFLVIGSNTATRFSQTLFNAYMNASEANRKIVDIVLDLDDKTKEVIDLNA